MPNQTVASSSRAEPESSWNLDTFYNYLGTSLIMLLRVDTKGHVKANSFDVDLDAY